jgi:hypothetical protein
MSGPRTHRIALQPVGHPPRLGNTLTVTRRHICAAGSPRAAWISPLPFLLMRFLLCTVFLAASLDSLTAPAVLAVIGASARAASPGA